MIDDTQIQYLERLARIRLDPAQRDAFRDEIGRILTDMERLAAIDGLPEEPAAANAPEAGPCMGADAGAAGADGDAAGLRAASDGSANGGSTGAFGLAACRPDTVRPSLSRNELLAMSPQATEEYLTVPLAVT